MVAGDLRSPVTVAHTDAVTDTDSCHGAGGVQVQNAGGTPSGSPV